MRSILVSCCSESLAIGFPLIRRLLSQNYMVHVVDTAKGCRQLMDWAMGLNGMNAKRRMRFVVYNPDLVGDFDFQIRQCMRDNGSICVINFNKATSPEIELSFFNEGMYIDINNSDSRVGKGIHLKTAPILLGRSEVTPTDWSCLQTRNKMGQPVAVTCIMDVVDIISNFILINPLSLQNSKVVPIFCRNFFDYSEYPGIPIDWLTSVSDQNKDSTNIDIERMNSVCQSLFKFTPSSIEEALVECPTRRPRGS